MLTLDRPAPDYEPDARPRRRRDGRWAPGTIAAILGWGESSTSGLRLRPAAQGDVTISDDADCYRRRQLRRRQSMLCAAGTPAAGDRDTCQSDSGSPLLVPDGAGSSRSPASSPATACATADAPGIFARVGADPLNAWVHDRTPEADFDLSHQPRASEPVTLFSTSRHPEGPRDDFTTLQVGPRRRRRLRRREGKSITTTFPTPGEAVVGLEASNAAAATGRRSTTRSTSTPARPPPARRRRPTTPTPRPTTNPRRPRPARHDPRLRPAEGPRAGASASASASRAPRPRGIAVIEVFRGTRRIGIARTRVRRGGDEAREREADADRPAAAAPRRRASA